MQEQNSKLIISKTEQMLNYLLIFLIIVFSFIFGRNSNLMESKELESFKIVKDTTNPSEVEELISAISNENYSEDTGLSRIENLSVEVESNKEVLETDNMQVNQSVINDYKFVASKKGKRYYAIDSAAAKNLSEKNKVYFNSEEEAQKAGFLKK